MTYFFVKDQVLSYMKSGVVLHKVICCSKVDEGICRRALKRSGFTVLKENSEPFPGYKEIYWKSYPRLEDQK